MLLFQAGEARYAMPGDDIVEVVPNVALASLPTTHPYVVGMLNYGGIPIPVIDFSTLVQGQPCRQALHTRIIIIQSNLDDHSLTMGLRAEKVTAVFKADPAHFQLEGHTAPRWPFVMGILPIEKTLLQLIDGNKLLAWYQEG